MAASKRADPWQIDPLIGALAGASNVKSMRELTMSTSITTRPDRATFLEPSPYEADGGHLVGRDPRQIDIDELRNMRHPESPVKAIRAKCIDCSGGNMAEVRKCTAVQSALWPMRMGSSPFHASSSSSKLRTAKVGQSSEMEAQS